MVVDDEKGIREALTQVLEYEKIEVRACASGSEALQRYPEFRPHLVFLDVKMQAMDGLETLRKLRELDPHAQVVMISVTGRSRQRSRPPSSARMISSKSPSTPTVSCSRYATRYSTWTLPARTYVSRRRCTRSTRSSARAAPSSR